MNKSIDTVSTVKWPSGELSENFEFSAAHKDGLFKFTFRWFNDHWNGWCTLPSGEVRAFGVYPNVISWTGFLDYGIVFVTNLTEISKTSLYKTELNIIKWI